MPTADDFDQAARIFTSVASDMPTLLPPVESARSAIRGGRLGAGLAELIADGHSSAVRWEDDLIAAADTCRTRAALIREIEQALHQFRIEQAAYEVELERYNQSVSAGNDVPTSRPHAPQPPNVFPLPSWVELTEPVAAGR